MENMVPFRKKITFLWRTKLGALKRMVDFDTDS